MGFIKISLFVVLILVTYSYLQSLFDVDLPIVLDGYYHPAFKPVADKFRENLKIGKERGGAFSVFHKGECVFDMRGGYADVEAQRPWREDTMTMAYSASKGIVAIVIATMVERGLLDYNRPVADYWPEFGQKGKGNITVGMLLSHQAGLILLDELVKLRDIKDDPKKVERILAAQETLWPAGSQFGYHALTYGMYADVLIRKADPQGRDVTKVFLEDLARPYDLDMFMNTPKDQYHRAARLYEDPMGKMLLAVLMNPSYYTMMGNFLLNPDSLVTRSSSEVLVEVNNGMGIFNDPHFREVHMSAALTTGTARGFAKLYGILANGGADKGKQLLSKNGVSSLSTPLVTGTDVVIQRVGSYGPGTFVQYGAKGQVLFGHAGHGGQVARADPTNQLGYAYLTNFVSMFGLGDDPRYLDLEETMYKCLDDFVTGEK